MSGPIIRQSSIAQSLYTRLMVICKKDGHAGMALDTKKIDVQNCLLILAGAMAECLMDFEDPFEQVEGLKNEFYHRLSSSDMSSGYCDIHAPVVPIMDLDRMSESGRAMARLYLEDDMDSARDLRCAILDVTLHLLQSIPSKQTAVEFFLSSVHYALSFEMITHLFCDRVIDAKIMKESWSIGDCLNAMSGLAGRYYVFASLQEDEEQQTIPRNMPHSQMKPVSNPKDILYLISAEAMRMGVPKGSGRLYGLAANDCPHKAYPHLVYSLEPIFGLLASRYDLNCFGTKTIAAAKAVGRMIAVASCGHDPEMEHVVARPLAMSSFMGSLKHFSNFDRFSVA